MEQIKITPESFLNSIFSNYFRIYNGFIEIRIINPNEPVYQSFYPTIDKLLTNFEKFVGNTYFGVAPKETEEGYKTAIKYITSLWVDVDFGSDGHKKKSKFETEKEALESINRFQIEPSIIVLSGYGFQCYWLLKEPYEITDTNQIEKILKSINESIGGDSGTHDITRILRLPSTLNTKVPDNPKKVEIIKFKPDLKYNLTDFKDYEKTDKFIEKKEIINFSDNLLQVDIEKLNISTEIKTLIIDGNNGKYPSRSEANQAVVNALVNAGYSNDIIRAIFTNLEFKIGEKYREKGNYGDKYLALSIEKAENSSVQKIIDEKTPAIIEPNLITWEKLKDGDYPVEWLVNELIEKTTVTIAYGESGSAKTWWALDLACCLTSGNQFLKKFEIPKAVKVLFITLEDREARIQERMQELIKGNSYNLFNGYLVFTGFKDHFNIETPILFEKAIEKHQPEIAIVDSLQWTFGNGYNENSSENMKDVMQFYRNLIKKFGITIILLHHTNKGGDPKYNPLYATPRDARGSTTLINLADQRIGFKIHPYCSGIFTVNFQSKGLPQRQFGFRLIGGQNEPKKLEYVDLEELKKLKKVESENNKNKILKILENEPHKEFTTSELVDLTGLSDTTVTKKLKELKKEKLIKLWDETKPFTAKIIDDTNSNGGIDEIGKLECQ